MRKIKLISQKKVRIGTILNEWLSSPMISYDNFFVKKFTFENRVITIYIVEDYYFRINAPITVTVIAEESADKTAVEVISSGGVSSIGFSYGAKRNALKRIVQLLKEYGFTEQ